MVLDVVVTVLVERVLSVVVAVVVLSLVTVVVSVVDDTVLAVVLGVVDEVVVKVEVSVTDSKFLNDITPYLRPLNPTRNFFMAILFSIPRTIFRATEYAKSSLTNSITVTPNQSAPICAHSPRSALFEIGPTAR